MPRQHLIRLISGVWVLIALSVFFVADAETFRSWLLLAMAGGVPPIMLLIVAERAARLSTLRHTTGSL